MNARISVTRTISASIAGTNSCAVVSDASVHDSQKFGDVLDASNTASDVWADSAYHSQEIEEKTADAA